AARLGVRRERVVEALERLERLGLLRRLEGGRLELTGGHFTTPDGMASMAIRRSHYQALGLARSSLDQDALDKRSFSAMTMAIDPSRLAKANEKIERFRRA